MTGGVHRLPWLLTALALAVLVPGAACGRGSNAPTAVSLAQLAANEVSYDGRYVQTQGTVRQFRDPDGSAYNVVEDGQANRVELVPASTGSAYVGRQVTVLGTFHFDDQHGRSIAVERLSPLGG